MDSLSQAALGAAVAVAITRGRNPRRAIVYGAVLATLPDLDVLQSYENDLQAMINHRSWSHAFLVHLVLGPLIGLLLASADKTWSRLRWIALVVGVWTTHAALDGFTIYGTWLFWPFSVQPVMGGSIFIIDPLYTLPLLVALFVVWHRPGSRLVYRSAMLGLVASSLYLGWGLYARQHIEHIARQSLADEELQSTRITATPTPFNSILWRVIAMDKEVYHEGYFNFLDRRDSIHFDSVPRHPGLVDAIPDRIHFESFENFNHGYYKLDREDGKVIASDLRMGLEPYFKFRFVIQDSQTGANVPRAAPEEIDTGRVLRWMGKRLTCPEMAPLRAWPGRELRCENDAPIATQ